MAGGPEAAALCYTVLWLQASPGTEPGEFQRKLQPRDTESVGGEEEQGKKTLSDHREESIDPIVQYSTVQYSIVQFSSQPSNAVTFNTAFHVVVIFNYRIYFSIS